METMKYVETYNKKSGRKFYRVELLETTSMQQNQVYTRVYEGVVVHVVQRGRLIGVSAIMSGGTVNKERCVVGYVGRLDTRRWIASLQKRAENNAQKRQKERMRLCQS